MHMNNQVTLSIHGRSINVPAGTTVAAALIIAGIQEFRRSVTGTSRGPLCGMGICFECRAIIDGIPHQKTCQILAQTGMEVQVDVTPRSV